MSKTLNSSRSEDIRAVSREAALMALNVAFEACRSGESGRDLAAVAGELIRVARRVEKREPEQCPSREAAQIGRAVSRLRDLNRSVERAMLPAANDGKEVQELLGRVRQGFEELEHALSTPH